MDADHPASPEYAPVHSSDLNYFKFTALVGLAHFTENSLMYPIWVVTTRQQCQRSGTAVLSIKASFKQMGHIYRTEGIKRGLYKGFLTQLICTAPFEAFYLYSYNFCRDYLNANPEKYHINPSFSPMAAGMFADSFMLFLWTPLDIVVQRLQLPQFNYTGPFDATRQIWKAEGYKGFYRGLGSTFICYAPASGYWWFTYEYCKKKFFPLRPTEAYSGKEHNRNYYAEMMAGLVAGGSTSILFNPLEVVKVRLQTQHNAKEAGTHTFYRNTWHGLKTIIKEEGVKSAMKGVIPRAMQRAPVSALFAFIYELILHSSKK